MQGCSVVARTCGGPHARDVQESEQEPELSKFFRSRIGLEVKFNVKTGVEVGAGVTISLNHYCIVN